MKILHLMSADLSSGAGRGTYWLHNGLLDEGVESLLLVKSNMQGVEINDRHVQILPQWPHKVLGALDRLPLRLYPNRDRQSSFDCALLAGKIRKSKWYDWADVVHLHWINGGGATLRELARIQKPIVWTLRDMWSLTGGCHYSLQCERWLSSCGRCPQLGSTREIDLSRLLFKQKKEALEAANIVFVGISEWISNLARRSAILGGKQIFTVRNTVQLNRFAPIEKFTARKALGLAPDGLYVSAGSMDLGARYKGFNFLSDLVTRLEQMGIKVLLFGKGGRELKFNHDNVHDFGYISDDKQLSCIYSASDVFMMTSLQEAFGKTVVEALSCDVPVVAFRGTAPHEVVKHKETGWLAEENSIDDFVAGVRWLIERGKNNIGISFIRRQELEARYSPAAAAREYLKIYRHVLGRY